MSKEENSSQRRLVFVLGCVMGAAAYGVDSFLPSLPAIAESFGISSSQAQFAVTISLIGFGVGQLPVGLLSDRYGRRVVAAGCLTTYVLGAILGALSESIEILFLSRFIQGIGAAGVGVTARAVVRDRASGRQAGRIMSGAISVLGGVTVSAPIIGGLLLSVGTWRTVLWSGAVYGVLALILLLSLLSDTQRRKHRTSAWQQLTSSFNAFANSPRSLFGTAIYTVMFAGLFVFVTTGSTVAYEVYGIAKEDTGWLVAAVASSYVTGSLVNQVLVERWGLFRMLGISVFVMGLAAAGLAVMSFWSQVPIWLLWPMIMMYGVGFGIVMPTVIAIVMDPLPNLAAFASSILGTVQSVVAAFVSAAAAAAYSGNSQSLCLFMGASGLLGLTIYLLGKGALMERPLSTD